MSHEKNILRPISVIKPVSGQTCEVSIKAGETYVLEFDPDRAIFEKQESDQVRVTFNDGAILVLRDVFVTASQGTDFTIELKDGTRISGQDLAASFITV